MRIRNLLWIGLILTPLSSAMGQRNLIVRAPASMQAALKAVVSSFQQSKPGVLVKLEQSGNPPDVDISELRDDAQAGREFAQDRLCVVAPISTVRVTKFSHIGLSMRIAFPSTQTQTGKHIATTLASAGVLYGKDWYGNLQRNLSVKCGSAAEAVAKVLDQSADVAIVNRSAVQGYSDKLKILPIPHDLADEIEYVAHVQSTTPQVSLANSFVEFLFTDGNQLHFEASGFTSPLRPPPDITIQGQDSMTRIFTAAIRTLPQASVRIRESGKPAKLQGASLAKILDSKQGRATFIGADRTRLTVKISWLRRSGGVLAPMGNGNYKVVIPGVAEAQWVRWLRRIVID